MRVAEENSQIIGRASVLYIVTMADLYIYILKKKTND